MNVTIKWVTKNGKWVLGDTAIVGKWPVGGAFYDACQSREGTKKYSTSVSLAGIKTHLGHFKTLSEAKLTVEKAINHWFSQIN